MSKTYNHFRQDVWQKNAFAAGAQSVGTWYCLSGAEGNPPPNTLLGAGTNLAFRAFTDALAGSGAIQHGGSVGGRDGYKRLLKASVVSSAPTTAPCTLMLVDLLGMYLLSTITATTEQAFDNTVVLPRYASGDGVQALITPSTVMGAGTPTITLKYTNSAGVADRTTPTTKPIGTTTAPVGSICYSGVGAGKYGPFVPLVSGDKGIRALQSITLSETCTSGVLNVLLAKPLLTLNITGQSLEATKEYSQESEADAPIIYDGACLAWLMLAGAATPAHSGFTGVIETGWR